MRESFVATGMEKVRIELITVECLAVHLFNRVQESSYVWGVDTLVLFLLKIRCNILLALTFLGISVRVIQYIG